MAQVTAEIYRPTARLLHWLVALLVIATIPAGTVMVQEGLPRWLQDGLFMFHKNVGVVILLLVLFRLAWRAANPPPPLPASVPGWQARIARMNACGDVSVPRRDGRLRLHPGRSRRLSAGTLGCAWACPGLLPARMPWPTWPRRSISGRASF